MVTPIVIYDRDLSEIDAGLTAAAWLQTDGVGSPPLERGRILATVSTRPTGER